MFSSSVTVLICSLQVQPDGNGYQEIECNLKKEDSVPVRFKETFEHLNRCSSIRTFHQKGVWPKITCEWTCQTPVITLLPCKVRRSGSMGSQGYRLSARCCSGRCSCGRWRLSLQRSCCAALSPFPREKSCSLSLSASHNLRLGILMPSKGFYVASIITTSQLYLRSAQTI